MDGLPLLSSPVYTALICLTYVYLVTIAGPNYMKDRKPMNIKSFMIIYNAFQVLLSAYICIQALRGGWWNSYSFRCQPPDYSDSYRSEVMLHVVYVFYLSKFTEMTDTFCFVARKKYNQVTLLHVVHHGIVPLSTWPGVRWLPGGHSSFWGLINSFVHFWMYLYYLMAAMGPEYQKYIWWKRYITQMQMIQFILIFVHSIQLFVQNDCNYPLGMSYFIAAHAVLFFILFANFYLKAYLTKRKPVGQLTSKSQNGVGSIEKTD